MLIVTLSCVIAVWFGMETASSLREWRYAILSTNGMIQLRPASSVRWYRPNLSTTKALRWGVTMKPNTGLVFAEVLKRRRVDFPVLASIKIFFRSTINVVWSVTGSLIFTTEFRTPPAHNRNYPWILAGLVWFRIIHVYSDALYCAADFDEDDHSCIKLLIYVARCIADSISFLLFSLLWICL